MERSHWEDSESYRVHGSIPPLSGATRVRSTYGKLFQNLEIITIYNNNTICTYERTSKTFSFLAGRRLRPIDPILFWKGLMSSFGIYWNILHFPCLIHLTRPRAVWSLHLQPSWTHNHAYVKFSTYSCMKYSSGSIFSSRCSNRWTQEP